MPVTLSLRAFTTSIGPLTAKVLPEGATEEDEVEMEEVEEIGVYEGEYDAAPNKDHDWGVALPDGRYGQGSFRTDANGNKLVPATASDIINPAGAGARTVTITVTDGANPIQGAMVRLTKNADTAYGTTGDGGTVVLNVDDGTWVVSITKGYYTFAGASLVVDGNESPTYAMTQVVIPEPADPAQCTCYCTTFDGAGNLQPATSIAFRLVTPPAGAGASYSALAKVVTSDGAALLSVALLRGAKYMAKRGEGDEVMIDVPNAATYQLPVVLSGDHGANPQ